MAKLPGQDRGSLEPYIKDSVVFRPYQIEGVRWGKRLVSCMIADEMGLGKTLQSLGILGMHLWELDRKYPGEGRSVSALVACPPDVMDNWVREINNFTGFNVIQMTGTRFERMRALMKFWAMPDPKVLVAHYDTIVSHLEELNASGIEMLIVDEAQNLKNPESKRSKGFRELNMRRKIMLTGTPIENAPLDLWPALEMISPGQWGTADQFRNEYCLMGGEGGSKVVGVKNEKRLREKMKPVVLRRLRKDHLKELPDIEYVKRYVHLHEEQQNLYDLIEAEAEITDGAGKPINTHDPMVRYMRFLQVCGTTYDLFDIKFDVSSKLDLAIHDAEEIAMMGDKLVVFTQFRNVQHCYLSRARYSMPDIPLFELNGDVPRVKRDPIVQAWSQVDGPAIIVGTMPVMAVGLNMTAGRVIQFLDMHYNPAKNAQAIGRISRIGAERHDMLRVIEYVTVGTREERVREIVAHKEEMADMILGEGESESASIEAQVRQALQEMDSVYA